MANWKGIVGNSYSAEEFDTYCHTLQWTAWRPSFIALHNTAAPSLAQRPDGLTRQHISNLEAYYRDKQKWKSGPHLFVDDKQIWVFTPLTMSGTHSPSWNKIALGIEMLGDYDKEAFDSGRGQQVRKNAVAAIATLSAVLGLDPDTMKLHKEDEKTTHACPGKNVKKTEFIKAVKALMAGRHGGDHAVAATIPRHERAVAATAPAGAGRRARPTRHKKRSAPKRRTRARTQPRRTQKR
jgi:N-acetylmuramoyl-L-alanine amidase CwlA